MTQSIAHQVAEAERRLARTGISLNRFCAGAGVNPTTWWRWKVGKSAPNLTTWDRVQQHLDRVDPRPISSDAAMPSAEAEAAA
ncbi:MAG: hypothetical protein RLZZ127_2578 [Planctomycetota bacterium]|jgi:hypothetical protein